VNGVLVIDKPAGITSADVVARVKARLGAARVGHTGTLDPMATGVLPIAIGEGTKLAPFLLADDKEYEGELELGVTTTTLDLEGEITGRADPSGVTEAAIAAALAAWVGAREQVPPMVSALRQGGRRLYELAREGIEVERAPRPIVIERLELLGFTPPRARFRVACSKGTYVRALARDAGEALGCGGALSALRRTRAGAFTLAGAVPLDTVAPGAPLVTLADAVGPRATVPLEEPQVVLVRHGKPLPTAAADGVLHRLLTPAGDLAAVAQAREGRLVYVRVFNYGLTSPRG
jgi:tRNA pseudouridine55 synthase